MVDSVPRRALIGVAVLAFAALTTGADSCDTTGGGGGKGKNEQSGGGGGAGSGGSTDGCDPNYEGACLDPNSADYDCEGAPATGRTM